MLYEEEWKFYSVYWQLSAEQIETRYSWHKNPSDRTREFVGTGKRRISVKSRSNMLQINSLRNGTVSFKKLDDVMNGARVFLGSFIIKHFPVASTRENVKWESGRSSLQSSPQGNQVIAAALRDGISCGMEITETFPHGGVFQLENPFQIRCDTRGLLILLRQRSSSAGACEIKRWALWTLSISA